MGEGQQYLIEFPREGCISIAAGATILEAALSAGISLFHVCGGNARCSTCRVLVLEGAEWLSPPNSKEQLLKDQMRFPRNVRLACQTFVSGGPVKLRRIIQDETDIGLYVGNAAGTSTQQLGEERELVLFFLDIRDFTRFVETQLAFDVIHIIRKLFTVFQNIIESNHGSIIETAGDGLYAVFGCETDRMKSTQSAVQSGFSILADLETLNETYFVPFFGTPVQVGIGIHIGKVISGTIRISNEDHQVVMGHPVNIASRLQAATKKLNNSFIVSSEVYQLLLHDAGEFASTTLSVKGISGKQTVYLLGKPYV